MSGQSADCCESSWHQSNHSLEKAPVGRLGDCARVMGSPEVISSPVGLVPRNALVLLNVRMAGKPEEIAGNTALPPSSTISDTVTIANRRQPRQLNLRAAEW